MRLPLVLAATLLVATSACGSGASSDAADQPTTASTVPTGATTPESPSTTVGAIVSSTVSPTTTVPCHVVEGGTTAKVYPGDCDGADGTVSMLQNGLNTAGFAVPVTGVFDDATEAAVKAFQAAAGLVADGLVGPLTWGALSAYNDTGCCDD